MNKETLKNIATLEFSNNTFSGGFTGLSVKQMSKINGGATNNGCQNKTCNTGSNKGCSNTVDCSGSNNASCTNVGGYCAISVPQ